MRLPHSTVGMSSAVAALIVLSGCGGSSPSPGAPSTGAPAPVPGATTVYGTERLVWNQAGDTSSLLFQASVNGQPVALAAATCNGAIPEAECSSPLPPLADGVHTIAIVAVAGPSSLESEPSAPITVQKVSTRSVVSAGSFPDARVADHAPGLQSVVTASSGLAFTIDVVARGLNGPVQLAAAADGRVFVAEADGRVRVVRPGSPSAGEAALEGRSLLNPPPVGPLGLALHPDFARNHFVYVAFLAEDGPDRTRLRIVRLREVGDTLGEPATLFEAPVVVGPRASRIGDPGGEQAGAASGEPSAEGPRLAFGPDGLLYTLLPTGIEFDNEPAASRPHASMLRITDEGVASGIGPLPGIIAHPLGFAWHPSTAALWLIFPGASGEAVIRTNTADAVSGAQSAGDGVLRIINDGSPSSGALRFHDAGTFELARVFPQGIDHASVGTLRLTMPILAESVFAGLSDRIIDLVPGGGAFYLATSSGAVAGRTRDDSGDVVVRLRPIAIAP